MKKNLKDKKSLNIAMLGHKRIPSREGGIEIVVEELATRMVNKAFSDNVGYVYQGSRWNMYAQVCTMNCLEKLALWGLYFLAFLCFIL